MLVRHAKSAWPPGVDDHARPLDATGIAEATALGRKMDAEGWIPDHVVSSDAVRALETWHRMAPALPPVRVDVLRKLYHAGADALGEVVTELGASPARLLAIGHNPGWEEVAHELTGQDVHFATAMAVRLRRRSAAPRTAGLGVRAWELVGVLRGGEP